MRLLHVSLLACLGAFGTATAAAASFASSPCVANDAATPASCAELARKLSHDIDSVRALGHELESRGHFGRAAAVYETALSAHPKHRDLTQRLIYSRGQARSAALLDAEPKPAGADSNISNPKHASSLSPPRVAGETARSIQTSPLPVPPPLRGRGDALVETQPKSMSQPRPTSQPRLASETQPISQTQLASTPTSTVASGRNIALVIGNERYKDFSPLRTPLNDMRALADVLQRNYQFTVHTLANATRYQIVSALSKLRREVTERDNVLIYYAGHGYLDDTTSRGYWLPVDAEHDNVANWLSTSDITDMLAGLQAKHALILADSCFSGTLLRSVGAAVAIDERGALLRKLAKQRSRTIMTSGGLEPVQDNGSGGHSVFAEALLKALRENRGELEAGRLFMQVRDRIALRASQTPQYAPLRNAGHEGGDFIFSRKEN